MRYENEQCPVCGKPFKQGDDIVVCPDCGTPHHRECYTELGKCVNSHVHSENFSWSPLNKQNPVREESYREQQNQTVICPNCSAENEAGSKFCKECYSPLMPFFSNDASEKIDEEFKDNGAFANEFIDNDNTLTVKEATLFIQKNKEKYIPVFIEAKKSGALPKYNFSAFIFGPFWFFYRKIYKAGLAIAGVFFAILCFIMTLYVKTFGVFISFIVNNYDSFSSSSLTDQMSRELLSVYTNCVQTHQREMTAIFLLMASMVLINLVMGFFANRIYLEKIKETVAKIKSVIPDKSMHTKYIYAKGGTSLLGAFNLGFIMYLLINFISSYVNF